jgi:hypothetical protein
VVKLIGLMMALAVLSACGPQVQPEVGRGPCGAFPDTTLEHMHSGFPVRCGPQDEDPH